MLQCQCLLDFTCAKDSTWNTRYPGKSNAVILTMAKYDMFKKWEDTKLGKRGEDYEEFKKIFGERIIKEGLHHYYPKTIGKVKYLDVATPLSFNYYINSLQGEVYGLENYPIRFQDNDWLRPDTDITNLYMTGQDVCTLGLTGAMMAGVITANRVLDYGTITDLITERNLVQDLFNVGNYDKKENYKKEDLDEKEIENNNEEIKKTNN